MNKQINTALAIAVIIIIAAGLGILIWLNKNDQSKSNYQPIVKKEIQQQNNTDRPAQEDIATIKAGYKILRISNGTTAFSFQIPENWETETRNSGEIPMTIEQKKKFLKERSLSTYSEKMSFAEIEKSFNEILNDGLPRIPQASVMRPEISNGLPYYIAYGDWNKNQINFHILKKDLDVIYSEANRFWCSDEKMKCDKENIKISGIDSRLFKTSLDYTTCKEVGKKTPCVTKAGAGRTYIFIPLSTSVTVVIEKQAKGDEQFENDFSNIIQTLKFEK